MSGKVMIYVHSIMTNQGTNANKTSVVAIRTYQVCLQQPMTVPASKSVSVPVVAEADCLRVECLLLECNMGLCLISVVQQWKNYFSRLVKKVLGV